MHMIQDNLITNACAYCIRNVILIKTCKGHDMALMLVKHSVCIQFVNDVTTRRGSRIS